MNDRRDLLAKLLEQLAPVPEASASVKRGKTGRSLDYHKPHQIQADILSAEWMTQDSPENMLSHPARVRFERELRNIRAVGVEQKMFRGRHFNPNDANRNRPACFGPPDPNKYDVGIGRYNPAGQAVLYLSSSESGVRAEVQVPPGNVLMSQSFRIPADLRIADLSNNDIDPFIANCFDRAEHMGPPDYFRSNVLAQLVASEFQGMLVPGVHGNPKNLYTNLVMFLHDHWPSWLDSSSMPRELK